MRLVVTKLKPLRGVQTQEALCLGKNASRLCSFPSKSATFSESKPHSIGQGLHLKLQC